MGREKGGRRQARCKCTPEPPPESKHLHQSGGKEKAIGGKEFGKRGGNVGGAVECRNRHGPHPNLSRRKKTTRMVMPGGGLPATEDINRSKKQREGGDYESGIIVEPYVGWIEGGSLTSDWISKGDREHQSGKS